MASQAAGEIVDELLNAVALRTQWDIAAKARALRATPNLSTEVVSGPHFDLCSVIRTLAPARILSNYSLRSRMEVLQLKCVDQKASGYCGHYALHFALCGLELCRSYTEAAILGYVDQLEEAGPFWRRYWLSIEELIRNARQMGEDSWWPWTRDAIMQGDMERTYMRHLLSQDSHCKHLGGAQRIAVLQYAYGQLHSSVMDVCRLQEEIDTFCTSTCPTCMSIVLGVTNHWLTVLAYRIPDTGHVGVLYMDSNNTPILMASDEELNQILELKEQEKMKCKGQGYTPWQRAIRLQAWKDQRQLIGVLSEALRGRHNLKTELLSGSWGTLIDSYYDNVCAHSHAGGHQNTHSYDGGHQSTHSHDGGHQSTHSHDRGHQSTHSHAGSHQNTHSCDGGHQNTHSCDGGHHSTHSHVGGHQNTQSCGGGHQSTHSHDGGHQNMCFVLLVQWLQHHCTQGIQETQLSLLQQVGAQWLSSGLGTRISKWVNDVRAVCSGTDLEETNHLLRVVDDTEHLLKEHVSPSSANKTCLPPINGANQCPLTI